MKRLVLAMLLLLCAASAGAMDIFSEPVIDDAGKLVVPSTTNPGASAMVYYSGTSNLAPIYTLSGVLISQPVWQDATGYITFRAPDGEYRIRVSGKGFIPKTIYRQFFDAADGDLSSETLTLEPQGGPPADPGDGEVYFSGTSLQVWDGAAWVGGSGGIVGLIEDTSPQLGNDLDVNGSAIVSANDGDIEITPDGIGELILDGLRWPAADGTAGQVLVTDGSGFLSFDDQTGGGSGDVTGPASAANNGIPVFDGPSGKVLKDSGATVGAGQLAGVSAMAGLAAVTPPTGSGLVIADNSASNVALTLANGGAGVFNISLDGTVDGVDVSALATSEGTAIHDATGGEIAAITEKATPASGDWLLIEDSAASNVKKKVQIGNLPTGGGGEANTGSNVGAGVGVYETKVGIDLRFNSLVSTTTALTITEDDPGDEAEFAIANAVAAGASGLMTGADKTKLDGVAAGADDVNNANVDAAGALMHIDADAKGDILVATAANTFARLAVGTNGQVLSANSTTSTGLDWVDASAGSGDVVGPASSTDNAVATFDGATGVLLQNTALTFATGVLTGTPTLGIACLTEISGDAAGSGLAITDDYATDVTVALSNTGTGVMDLTLDGDINGVDIDATGIPDGYVLTAQGGITAGWEAPTGGGGGISNVVEDTTPQLGGSLDVNGQSIVSVSNGNIPITPNGTGNVVLDGLSWPEVDGTNGQALTTNGSATLGWTTITGGSSAVQWRYKASDTARANDATYTADPDLDDIALEASSRYTVDLFMFTSVPSATPDIKVQLLADDTDWLVIGNMDLDSVNSAPTDYGAGQADCTIGLWALTLAPGIGRWQGTIITAGAVTFDVMWGQNTSDAGATTVLAGSYIRVEKMN